jgi:hypothetical protein
MEMWDFVERLRATKTKESILAAMRKHNARPSTAPDKGLSVWDYDHPFWSRLRDIVDDAAIPEATFFPPLTWNEVLESFQQVLGMSFLDDEQMIEVWLELLDSKAEFILHADHFVVCEDARRWSILPQDEWLLGTNGTGPFNLRMTTIQGTKYHPMMMGSAQIIADAHSAYISRAAFEAHVAWSRRYLPSIVTTFELAGCFSSQYLESTPQQEWTWTTESLLAYQPKHSDDFPRRPQFRFIRSSLLAVQESQQPKGEVPRRLRNALILLAESDNSASPVVKLVTSVAALEALLCRSKEGISRDVAENASTLLITDPGSRLAAQKAVKDLYAHRSKAVHGADLTEAQKELHARRARRLAASVVAAFLEWREFRERLEGTSEKRDAFFEDLAVARTEARPMLGVSTGYSGCFRDWANLDL